VLPPGRSPSVPFPARSLVPRSIGRLDLGFPPPSHGHLSQQVCTRNQESPESQAPNAVFRKVLRKKHAIGDNRRFPGGFHGRTAWRKLINGINILYTSAKFPRRCSRSDRVSHTFKPPRSANAGATVSTPSPARRFAPMWFGNSEENGAAINKVNKVFTRAAAATESNKRRVPSRPARSDDRRSPTLSPSPCVCATCSPTVAQTRPPVRRDGGHDAAGCGGGVSLWTAFDLEVTEA